MWKTTELTQHIGLQYPIIQAPMAGGATTAELVAAVSNAGGLGSLGAGYMPASDIREAITRIRQLTDQPFSVNLFIPEPHQATPQQIQTASKAINQCASELAISIQPISGPYSQTFEEQVNVLLDEKVPVFSFTFGLLDNQLIAAFKQQNIYLIGTATTLAEATALKDNGIDAIVAQGSEAGGHRGSFLDTAENSLHPIDNLVNDLIAITDLPIIAAGGIMNGQRIVELINAGACATQLGTAFLCCTEAGIHPHYKQKILQQQQDNTVLTRAFSGKLARGINNKFTDCMKSKSATIAEYPIQNKLTGPMRMQAKKQSNPEYMSLWAGTNVHLARKLATKALIDILVDEAGSSE